MNTKSGFGGQAEVKASLVVRALWRAAGVEPSILVRGDCRTDRARYALLGMQVVVNALIAGGLATAVASVVGVSGGRLVATGAAWTLFIGLMDMAMMLGARRRHGESVGALVRRVAGRIVLALIAGRVMGAGLEQIVHHDMIQLELERRQVADAAAVDDLIAKRYADLPGLRSEIAAIERSIAQADSNATEARREAIAEADGTGGSRQRGPDAIYRIKAQAADQAKSASRSLRESELPRLAELRRKLDERLDMQSRDRGRGEHAARAANAFTARYLALRRLEKAQADGGVGIVRINLILALLAVAIELAPLTLKMFLPRGPYDAVHDRIEAAVITRADAMRAADQERIAGAISARRARRSAMRWQSMRLFDEVIDNARARSTRAIAESLTPVFSQSATARLRRWIRADLWRRPISHSSARDTEEAQHRNPRDAA